MADILWNLSSIYPSLESSEYLSDKEELVSLSAKVLEAVGRGSIREPEAWIPSILESLNRLYDLAETLESYVYALWSTNTSDQAAQGEIDDLERRNLVLKDAFVRFRGKIGEIPESLWKTWFASPAAKEHSFWLSEQRFLASRQMSPAEEALAADLQRSGGDAWDRLHGKLSSSVSRPWESSAKTVTELRALAYHGDREVRRQAWKEECAAWKEHEIAFAAALNGVKGTSVSLNERRGWGSTLEKSLFQNRLSRGALDAMLGTMTKALPLFRRYFNAKARFLGIEKLSWYDLFAPLPGSGDSPSGDSDAVWSWERCRDFIPAMFDTLSPEMGVFARKSFADSWMDASPRAGKLGGAYCIFLPLAGESRIMANFDGSFDSVSTVAHELGHAWHGEVMKDLKGLNREYPMTLAETASIFSETLVFRAALEEAPESARPAILDTYLMGAAQVIVDILSRFHFESALMRSRAGGELSAAELTDMMLEAQGRTYGDALNPDERHGWMWAVKGHYYSPDLAYYNFPYAFGQLFALGLFARFKEEGDAFAAAYRDLLQATGSADAAAVAKKAGFNIESPDFWQKGVDSIAELVGEYEYAAGKTT